MSMFGRLIGLLRKHVRRMFIGLTPQRLKARALVTWMRQDSTRLFYVFQGKEMRLMMEPMSFLRETGLIHENLVMLRDYQRFFYHAGLNRELPDIGAIRERLRDVRRQLPHVTQTFCLGSSAGGYAAILFGHYLDADTVYAFAPQTLIDLQLLRVFSRRRDTWRFPEAHRDLALLLAGHNGHTRYKIYYCQGNAKDSDFAQRIGGCPGVELCPQIGDTHLVIQEMYETGRLREMFSVDVPAVAA